MYCQVYFGRRGKSALARIKRSARALCSAAWTIALVGMVPAPGVEAAAEWSRPKAGVVDLLGQSVNPFPSGKAVATVFLFVSVDCPISNSYAPEVRRLASDFAPRGVVFKLVYPNPDETAKVIEKHLRDYGYTLEALRDTRHELAKAAQVKVTPEAAVFVPHGGLVYHGRIDDRYVDFGKARPAATIFDLKETLQAIVAGKPVPHAVTRAVGCYISETP
jgi:hypothetical protein